MVNYLVAIDESDNSKAAFFCALSMIRPNVDHLYVLTVVEDITKWAPFAMNPLYGAQEEVKKEGKKLLQGYGRYCKRAKVNFSLLISIGEPKDVICDAVDKKKIDFLIMGRRGMSKVKRIFLGSVSKYCIEHANCNVLIIKGDWAPSEEHSDLKAVIAAEEAERKERINHQNDPQVIKHKQEEKEIGKQASAIAGLAGALDELAPVLEFNMMGTQ